MKKFFLLFQILFMLANFVVAQHSTRVRDSIACIKLDTDTMFTHFDSELIDSMVIIYKNFEIDGFLVVYKIDKNVFTRLYKKSDRNIFTCHVNYDTSKLPFFNFNEFYNLIFDPEKKYDIGGEDDTVDRYFKFKLGATYATMCYMKYSSYQQIFIGKFLYLDRLLNNLPLEQK